MLEGYPLSQFPDWTRERIARSKIDHAILKRNPCTIYHVDVNSYGLFADPGKISTNDDNTEEIWNLMIHTKVRIILTYTTKICGPTEVGVDHTAASIPTFPLPYPS